MVSSLSARWNNLWVKNESAGDLKDGKAFFGFVFARTPYYAIVRPTEMYYYYVITENGLWGNMNFKEIKNGTLSFAYFNPADPTQYEALHLTAADGLTIKMISDTRVNVTYQGKTVRFEIPAIETEKPESLTLLPDEEFVSKVQDESGLRFYLLYNTTTKSFYDVVNNERPLAETETSIDQNLTVGDRTHFVYFNDLERNRKIIVGVDTQNILENNYFDGPFDQVPPHLPIRDRLYAAYPYTQYLNGLDPYGNFIDWKGSRVAITPYTDYDYPDFSAVQSIVKQCSKENASQFLSCITYESKKDFHKTIPEFFYPDGRKKP